jgi:hypothetical protein
MQVALDERQVAVIVALDEVVVVAVGATELVEVDDFETVGSGGVETVVVG